MSKTYLAFAGHGLQTDGSIDPGAFGLIKKGEHRYVAEDLFPAMKKHVPKGANVIFFSAYDVYNHGDIVALAAKYKADEVIEFHYDSASASARGGHVIVHKDFSPDKLDLAIRDVIKKMVTVRYTHKGHKGISGRNDLANVNRAAKAGISYRLVELGFGTNKEDAKVMVDKVDEYAKLLVEAIVGSVSQNKDDNKTKSSTSTNVSKPKEKPKKQPKNYLSVGDKGTKVLKLQKQLVSLGYYIGKAGADSSYGKDTEKAVRKFQKVNNLVEDGFAGEATQAKLANKPKMNQIAEDGYPGVETITLAQAVYNMRFIDGVISGQPINASTRNFPTAKFGENGSLFIKELQREFGSTGKQVDGRISAVSRVIKNMQKHFGTPVDGKVSSPSKVIKAFQKALNKGKRK